MEIAAGQLFAMFSFDVGFEIDLARLRALLANHADVPTGERVRHGSPARAQYPAPAVELPCGVRALTIGDRASTATVATRAHEFGAVTVLFSVRFDGVDCEGLPVTAASLTTGGELEREARSVLQAALPRLAPAITRPAPDGYELIEDYYVIQVTRFAPDVDAPDLLGTHRDLLARIVHCEPKVLSPSETDEVLRTAVTYTPRDLVVTDWNVALVYDEDYQDALDVLELLNVQLLELRFLDAMLDRRINALYEHVARPRRLLSFRREVVRVRELFELRLDTASVRERLVNAVKLVGDLYLTKIYARTADRLHLGEWQRSLDGKLELVQKIADVLAGRATTARAEILELIIILLILFEIVLFFVR